MDTSDPAFLPPTPPRRRVIGLACLFGAIYFVQGIAEPTEGLIAQPVRSILGSWGRTTGEVALFSGLIATPWAFKPLYGLLTDFVPLFGSRRKGYLVLAGLCAAMGLALLWLLPLTPNSFGRLRLLLVASTVAVAFGDVVADGLMVDVGQPLRLTGRLQSVQWGSLYASAIVAGLLGGSLSEHHRPSLGFLICAVASAASVVLALVAVREPPRPAGAPTGLRQAGAALGEALRSGAAWGVGGFLFLFNFNPFSNSVLHLHMTRVLGFREQFYGASVSVLACGSMAACLVYGAWGDRIPMRPRLHGSIVLGIASTLAYGALAGPASALLVSFVVGLTYMLATLVQLDLAARTCPPRAAGTVFALLMALSNLGVQLSTALGGVWYDLASARWGSRAAFLVLVGLGAAFTAACWLVLPWLPSHPEGRQRPAMSDQP